MEYVFTFVEGIASFISPCILPLLPVYISYFAGSEEKRTSKTVRNAIGFVLGYSIVFVLLAILATTASTFITSKIRYIEKVFGAIVILLGLNYMEIINIPLFNVSNGIKSVPENLNFISYIIFGMLFSVSQTPCVGTFLASALVLIADKSDFVQGIILMLVYCFGLGIPFVLSAFLIDKLKNAFNFIKKHYKVFKILSGIVLIGMGIYIIFF